MKRIAILAVIAISLTGCATETVPLTVGDDVLDMEFFQQATSSGNLDRCAEIVEATLAKECEAMVNASTMVEKAVANSDLSACKKINVDRYKENCTSRVNENIKIAKADEKRLSLEQEAVDSGNADACDKITSESQMVSCKFNVLAKKAAEENDPSLCDEIGEEESISKCKSAIQ